MSEVKVNKISPRSGTAITLGDSGDTFTIPSGATLAIAGSVTGFTSAGIDDNATSVAITINSSEQVGIGTTSPASLLDIQGTGVVAAFKSTNNNTVLRLKGSNATNGGGLGSTSSGDLTFLQNLSEGMRLTSTGLGIGTSSPSQKLEVNGNIKTSTTGSVASGALQGIGGAPIDIDRFELGVGFLNLDRDFASEVNQIQFGKSGTLAAAFATGQDYLVIKTNGNNERVRIDSSGKVGIGTSAPSEALDVVGNANITNSTNHPNLEIRSTITPTGSTTGGQIKLSLGSGSNSGSGNADTQAGDKLGMILFNGQGTDFSYQGAIIEALVTTGDGNDVRANQGVDLIFGTKTVGASGYAEKARITAAGNVGIGTSSPTAKLNVNGAIVGGQKGDSSPDNTDVSGVNSLTVSTGAGSRTINGLVGGVTGQVLHIIKTNSASTLTIADQNATSPGVEIKTADGNNISLTNFGGVTLLFYDGAWWEVGK